MMKKISIFLLLYSFSLLASNPFDEMLLLYELYGGEKYMIQEEISQKSHVLQAARIAELAGAPEHVIVGLLFHDIGQIAYKENLNQVELLHANHAELGAKWLKEQHFPSYVVDWVENHALAKVILCKEDSHYYEQLSTASKISYQIQKEKYEAEENQQAIQKFQKHLYREEFKAARKCDDMAKLSDYPLPDFESYRAMTMRVIKGEGKLASQKSWIENINQFHRLMAEDLTAFKQLIHQ